ncbi:hypothetical protein T492DRAFT_1152586 [Pavlovales sp. CCMP2436]|nr:hypothetical protein T492DRAFT_1152586 [Pavlovales sp. CCMP2436]
MFRPAFIVLLTVAIRCGSAAMIELVTPDRATTELATLGLAIARLTDQVAMLSERMLADTTQRWKTVRPSKPQGDLLQVPPAVPPALPAPTVYAGECEASSAHRSHLDCRPAERSPAAAARLARMEDLFAVSVPSSDSPPNATQQFSEQMRNQNALRGLQKNDPLTPQLSDPDNFFASMWGRIRVKSKPYCAPRTTIGLNQWVDAMNDGAICDRNW